MTLHRHIAGRRILGLTFDGRPIAEPVQAGSSITFAAAGGGKTTCVSVPAVMAMLADRSRAICVNAAFAAQGGPPKPARLADENDLRSAGMIE